MSQASEGVKNTSSARRYPVLSVTHTRPTRPISFVVVRYSDDYFHNILRSDAVRDPVNQLITIDNRRNLFYANLTLAINAGLDQAEHELVAIVHEDVLLPDGWHARLERSLLDLEQVDPDWGLLGSVGWTRDGGHEGHWSDPRAYGNTLTERSFVEVDRIDEQLMILRGASAIRLDGFLPSIHFIGVDLPMTLRQRGLHTYVVNAPTIHKFADEHGKQIQGVEDSPKIQARQLPPFIADMASCTEYFQGKWSPDSVPALECIGFRPGVLSRLSQPIVLVSRGGSGSRLLSWLAEDAGVFLGNDINVSGDAMEMVQALYMAVLDKHQVRAQWQKERIVPRIRLAAARMLERAAAAPSPWGFKLPECMLLMPELFQAFGEARCLHLIRDPLTTCLRRTHMTARFDNVVGRVAIREAYRYCGRDLEASLTDSPALRMAYTTVHQVETARAFADAHLVGRYLEVRFEDLLQQPRAAVLHTAEWLGTQPRDHQKLDREVDPMRAAHPAPEHCYTAEIEEAVAAVLAPLRRALGYIPHP